MKMIMAIVQPKDSNRVRDALAKNKIGVTKLATSGGFLHEGNTTFMIVVDDDRVDETLEIIKENAKTRQEYMTPTAYIDNAANSVPIHVQVGGATIFILPVDKMVHF
ncbi:cyclic-di-AMP receptor [Limosilactobacillus caecicola]|uniref:cyclic-di-AMP receptor n=1 Tax=Limosilactobacillus caecicola TaxID=2941332 RepID=UPI00204074A4|nr:cyclic-di-AMP receptor [Limosilactobacillus caecicola]